MKKQAVRVASASREESFVAIYSNLGAVVDKEEGAVTPIFVNEGRIAQAWVNDRGMRVFCRILWALRRMDAET